MPHEPLSRLISIMPPPRHPTGSPSRDDWNGVEASLGTALPGDFKSFVDTYGAGIINNLIVVESPSFPPGQDLFARSIEQRLSVVRAWRKHGHEDSYATYPEEGGLLPWGGTAEADAYYWLTEPRNEPDRWPIVVFDRGYLQWREYAGPATAFLADALERKIKVPNSAYLEDPPDFEPVDPLYETVAWGRPWPGRPLIGMDIRGIYGWPEEGLLLVQRYLGRGQIPGRIQGALTAAGVDAPEELVRLYGQVNGMREDRWARYLAMHEADRPSTAAPIIEFAPGLRFPSVENALAEYQKLRVGSDWRPEWWPVFMTQAGWYAVECRGGDRGAVWFVPLAAPDKAERRYEQLVDMVQAIASRFESGAWAWSDEEWRFRSQPGSEL